MYSPTIQNLIKLFSKFPTIGPRAATRFVFYLISQSKEETSQLIKSISELKEKIKLCQFCFTPFEGNDDLCEICSSQVRDKSMLCIVEKESDLVSIEKTKKYKGFYFILGGTVSRLKKTEIEKLRIKELIERTKTPNDFGIESSGFNEILIATNPTIEGNATALYIEKSLKPLNIKITHLGRGMPSGGELEYADEETLSDALEGRK